MNSLNDFSFEESQSLFLSGQVKFLSFSDIYKCVKSKMEFDCFEKGHKALANEMCLIICEVLKLPPMALVRISRNDIPAEMVSDVFLYLTHEHIEFVIEKFKNITYEIKNKKTYLRTALYNSVFELETHYENKGNIKNDKREKNKIGEIA